MITTGDPTRLQDAALPSLGITVTHLLSLYADENSTTRQVVQLLERDPAITSRLLRLANSAYYGFESKVDTLQRAVVLLGSATVQGVALGAHLLSAWGRQQPPPEVQNVWVAAYLCAKGCRHLGLRLARDPHRSAPDALFLTGLLHPIGKILFLAQAPTEYAQALHDCAPGEELHRREAELFGWDHATAGGELLESWNLPLRLSAVIRHQYSDCLRAELRPDWNTLVTAAAAVHGPGLYPAADLPEGLRQDLDALVDTDRSEAEAFYAAIA